MKIYCAHQITGLTPAEVFSYYHGIKESLTNMGYDVLHPMTGKNYLSSIKEFTPTVSTHKPMGSNHAIVQRDKWMVQNCDILLTDLRNATHVSIGCVSELAWGDLLGKHTVVVMEKNSIHEHGFILEMADVIFETIDEALEYLKKMAVQEI